MLGQTPAPHSQSANDGTAKRKPSSMKTRLGRDGSADLTKLLSILRAIHKLILCRFASLGVSG